AARTGDPRGSPGGSRHPSATGEQAEAGDRNRGGLGGTVDLDFVATMHDHECGDRSGDDSRKKHRRQQDLTAGAQQSGSPSYYTEDQEGAHPRKARLGSAGVTGPLSLDAYGQADQRGDGQPEGGVELIGHRGKEMGIHAG